MKESYWGYWVMIIGVFIIVIMLLIQNVTTKTMEEDYDTKQITQAAMIDAIDYAYYRDYGTVRINKEKFIESFLRRYADVSNGTTTTEITFTNIYEDPPKVSVEIKEGTQSYTINSEEENFDIVSRIDEILETNN